MRTVRLGDVAGLIRGVSFDGGEASPVERPGLLPVLRAGNIADRLILDRDLIWVPATRVSPDQRMRHGDIAVCLSSGSASVVGKTALLDQPFDGSVGAFCGVIRPGPRLLPEFLAAWFRSPAYRSWRDGQSRGASIQNLRVSTLTEIAVPVPPLDEQRRIAAQLTDQLAAVDRARTASRQRLADAEALVATSLQDALGHSGKWGTGRLGDIVEIQLGKMLSPASKTGQRPMPYLRNANVQWDRFELAKVHEMDFDLREEEKFRLRRGDVLVCEGGEPGRAAVWMGAIDPCFYQKALHRLRPISDSVDPQYLVYRLWLGALRGEFTDDHAKTTIAHLPAVRLAELEVSIPPIDEQRRIVTELRERLVAVASMTKSIAAGLEAIEALPAALSRRAFHEG